MTGIRATTSPLSPAGTPSRWLVLVVVLAAEVMDVLDSTVVNVAGPVLERELGATPTQLQWVIGGYALALGAGLVIGGRLGDRFGRRRMFLLAVAGFTLASLLCALAPTVELLIATRFIQGAFGALLLPQGFALLREVFGPKDLATAFAVFGPVLAIASVAGPILGGLIVDADIAGTGWRFAFFVNVPVGLVAFIIAARTLKHVPAAPGVTVDLLGAALIAISSGLLVLPLVQGPELGWPLWTWLSIAGSLAGFVLFAAQQLLWQRRGLLPLVEPGLFRRRAFTAGTVGMFLFFGSTVGFQLVMTFYLQAGQGFSPSQAGLSAIPFALALAVGAALSGAVLARRLGRGVLQLGCVLQFAGAALLLVSLISVPDFTIGQLVPGLVVGGFGNGLVMAALIDVVIGGVADHEVGSGSGVLAAVQSIGAAAGIAVLSGLFFTRTLDGDPTGGFALALLAQLAMLALFLLVSLFFPSRPRADP